MKTHDFSKNIIVKIKQIEFFTNFDFMKSLNSQKKSVQPLVFKVLRFKLLSAQEFYTVGYYIKWVKTLRTCIVTGKSSSCIKFEQQNIFGQ